MLQLLCTNEYVNQNPGNINIKSEVQQLAQITTKLDANNKPANKKGKSSCHRQNVRGDTIHTLGRQL